ncbi:MAG: hypothetical protein PHO31_02190, partial [Candidatus Pacebacteria bacterium]|nr:hypothetical protein [Candidatus Paceibacterota bacterium]
MKSSIWKTIWQVSDKILGYIFILFGICYFVILILIFVQEKSDWYDTMTIFTIFYAIDILTAIAIHLPIWVQIIYFPCFLFFYYTRAYKFFYSLNLGINYDFVWTLPQKINNFFGISLQGKIIDFIFWSGFICTLLLFLMQIKAWILKFLIKRNVGFALEVEKEAKEQLMNKKIKYGTNQIEKPLTTKQKIKKGIF